MHAFVVVPVLFLQFLAFRAQRAVVICTALRDHSLGVCVCVCLKMFDIQCIHAAISLVIVSFYIYVKSLHTNSKCKAGTEKTRKQFEQEWHSSSYQDETMKGWLKVVFLRSLLCVLILWAGSALSWFRLDNLFPHFPACSFSQMTQLWGSGKFWLAFC